MAGFSDPGGSNEMGEEILLDGDQAEANNDKGNHFGQPKSRFRGSTDFRLLRSAMQAMPALGRIAVVLECSNLPVRVILSKN